MKMKTLIQVNSKATYTFDPREVALRRPEIQARIAHAISIWSLIDSLTVNVVCHALQGDVRIAAQMFASITSAPASNAAMKSAIRLGLKPKHSEIFNAIWILSSELVQERHKLAHWGVGYSDEIPDALLLFDPKDGFLRGAQNLSYWRLGQHERFTPRPINKIRVASREYLDNLISDLLAQLDRISWLLDLLRLDETAEVPASVIRQRYDQLYNEPQIHQILIRDRANRKAKKATQRRRSRANASHPKKNQ